MCDKSWTPCDKAVVVFAMLLMDCLDEEPRVDPNDGRGHEEPRKGGYGIAGDRENGRVSERGHFAPNVRRGLGGDSDNGGEG